MEKITGIYCIISKIKPERVYIGSSTCIEQRCGMHLSSLKLKKHHSIKLQNHYNKYGRRDLLFLIIRSCPKERLLKLEQFFIDREEPWFNICKIAGRPLGIKRSKMTRKKMKDAAILDGRRPTFLGCTHSEESKKKQSEAHTNITEETRQKQRDSHKGKHFLKETCDKMGKSRIGNINGFKSGIPSWNKGISCSKKTSQEMSKGQIKRMEDPEQRKRISEGLLKYWELKKANKIA